MYSSSPPFHTPRRSPWRRGRFISGGLLIVTNDDRCGCVAIGILLHLAKGCDMYALHLI